MGITLFNLCAKWHYLPRPFRLLRLSAKLGTTTDAGPDLQKWIAQYNWKDLGNGSVFIANQEEIVKTKNITEKIDFESESPLPQLRTFAPPVSRGRSELVRCLGKCRVESKGCDR